MKIKMKICARCKKNIGIKEKYVHIEDFENGKITNECFLHYQCWKNLFDEKMKEKIQETTDKLKAMLPGLQNLMGNLSGGNNIQ